MKHLVAELTLAMSSTDQARPGWTTLLAPENLPPLVTTAADKQPISNYP